MRKFLRIGLLAAAVMAILAISAFAYSGVDEIEISSTSWKYTATLDGSDNETAVTSATTPTTINEGDMYLLLVLATSDPETDTAFPETFTADDILYIDQITADATDEGNQTVVFSDFIPLNYTGGKAFVTGGSLGSPTYIGYLPGHGVLGDANGDQSVNVADITAIRDHILERSTLDGMNLEMADVNNDSSVNVADITKIRDYILQRITSLS